MNTLLLNVIFVAVIGGALATLISLAEPPDGAGGRSPASPDAAGDRADNSKKRWQATLVRNVGKKRWQATLVRNVGKQRWQATSTRI
jgi:hypothetical protein